MFRLFSRSNPSRSHHPVLEEPPQPAITPKPKPSHQPSAHHPSKTVKSVPNNEFHAAKKPSFSHPANSHPPINSYNYTGPRKLWDTQDTFLPRARPIPPLPKLDKHRYTSSQHHIESPLARSSTGRRQPPSMSSQSTSTDPSLCELSPILDNSREHPVGITLKTQRSLTRSNTGVTASSGTSDESAMKKRKPPLAVPSECIGGETDKQSKLVRSLSRLGSRKRAQSNPPGARDAPPKTLEPAQPFHLVNIVGDPGRCPSSGVKIQCYEGWHEKPAEDVIHMLRELRFK